VLGSEETDAIMYMTSTERKRAEEALHNILTIVQPRQIDWLSSSDDPAECEVTSFVDGAVPQRLQEAGRLGTAGPLVRAPQPRAAGNCQEVVGGGEVRDTAGYTTARKTETNTGLIVFRVLICPGLNSWVRF